MNNHQLTQSAGIFKKKLIDLKAALGPQEFPWYPHDSFGYMGALEGLLGGGTASLLRLAGEEPVLDIGCADGTLGFFMESLGPSVDVIDHPPTNYNGMRGVRRLKEALGSSVSIHAMDIDDRLALPRETYGLTLLLGILYHLKNPFYVLEELAKHSRYCLMSTRMAQVTPKGARMQPEALAYLVDDFELNSDATNYWIFSDEGLKRLVRRSGWNMRAYTTFGCTRDSDPVHADRDERSLCLLESRYLEPRFGSKLLHGWHEMEGNWRWTDQSFAILATPDPVAKPTHVELRFFLVPLVLEAIGAVTVEASINGKALERHTFDAPGEHVYRSRLPEGWSNAADLAVEFKLDKYYKVAPDPRQLGLLISFFKPGFEVEEGNVPLRFTT